MRSIILLGASGSIGEQTLNIIKQKPKQLRLVGFSVGQKISTIESILKEHPYVTAITIKNQRDLKALQEKYPTLAIYVGDEGLLKLIDHTKSDMVVNALVGFVGFLPTVQALKNNIDVALANKESLVVGGEIINELLKSVKAKIYPIDSEHVALSKCLKNHANIERIILTASGGSFRNYTREQLKAVTIEQALNHPSWNMGAKITIDSATMMNKGFEIIEAFYLFNVPVDKISILLHDESLIHSLVEFKDGSFLADIGPADMRIPISYALFKRKRVNVKASRLPLSEFKNFHFREFDSKRYPCVEVALQALKIGGTMLTVLNAANEVAVSAFLNHEISFLEIETVIIESLKRHRVIKNPNIDDIIYIDKLSRAEAHRIIQEAKR